MPSPLPSTPPRASRAAVAIPAERVIGAIRGEAPGPTLIVVGSVHGNELAGSWAAERVLGRLASERVALRGEVIALTGNLAGARLGKRYQVKDLNRQWTDEKVEALRHQSPSLDDAEDAEQRALLGQIEAAIGRARGEVFLVDLHTTSAAGFPFVLFGDTLPQRAFALDLPLPVILGLAEQVEGVLSEFMSSRGVVTYAVEGGQHDDPRSVDHLEAVVWLALTGAGLLDAASNPKLADARRVLDGARGSLPRVLEVLRRHAITPDDAFRMEPGFANLAPAARGQLLARDRRGELRAETDGFVMLPLYQGQGEDGFFWGREVSEARLAASSFARRLHLDRVLARLPGVRSEGVARLHVDTSVARLYPLEVFHFFGYRKVSERGSELVVERAHVGR